MVKEDRRRLGTVVKTSITLHDFLQPLGSQDFLYKLENVGWLVDVATDRHARHL